MQGAIENDRVAKPDSTCKLRRLSDKEVGVSKRKGSDDGAERREGNRLRQGRS